MNREFRASLSETYIKILSGLMSLNIYDIISTNVHDLKDSDRPMNETEIVNGLNSQYTFSEIESGDVFRKCIVFDEHCHQVASR